MEEVKLIAKKREITGKQVAAYRRQGELPAIIYGHMISPIPIFLDMKEISRILPSITSSQLVMVDIEGDQHTALVREKQRHPVTGKLQHIDFMAVSLTEKLRAYVTIEFEGQAPAVSELGGVLVTGQEEIEVECLPKDLPDRILVTLSNLKNIGDSIHVRDLEITPNVEILTDLNEMVILITAPAVEEIEEVEKVEEVEGEPEVIEKGKKEEEEQEEE